MKINSFFDKIILFFAIGASLACGLQGCRTKPDPAVSTEYQTVSEKDRPSDEVPMRLITDYGDLQQNDIISWVWIKSGVMLDRSQPIRLHPLENYSGITYPWAEQKMQEALNALFESDESDPGLGLRAAIVEMKVQPGLLKRYFPSIEDYPYIEVEIIIFEESTKKIIFKLCHWRKDKEFSGALQGMIQDLNRFFEKEA